jgi:HlyD family secretion protein
MKKINLIILLILIILYTGCSNSDDLNYIEGSGNIEVTNIVLSSQTSGNVEQIIFNEGDQAELGDTLLIIDHELLLIKLKQAVAGMNAAKAQLDLAITGARKEDIKLAEEQLNQAKSNFESASADFERMKNLYSEKVITKKQFDDAETRYLISQSQLNAATENLRKVKNISRPEEIIQVRSNFENAEANVQLIKKQIKDSHIISPMNGFVVERFVELGESVNFGSSTYKISDLSTVQLVVYVNEENLGKVKLGQKAEVFTDSFKEKAYEGKVIYISPEAEFTPKNIQTKDERTKLVFAVKIELKNPEFELKAGMPADAKISIND